MAAIYKTAWEAVRDAIEAGFTSIPIAWPTGGYSPGADVSFYCQVDWMPDAARRPAGESDLRRILGFLQFRFYYRTGQEPATAWGYMDDLAALFPAGSKVTAGTQYVRFDEPSPGPRVQDGEGWHFIALRCPFFIDAA